MSKQYQKSSKKAGLITAMFGMVIGLPAIAFGPSTAHAMPRTEADKPVSQTNPNPSIFNEAPYNTYTSSNRTLNPNPSIFNEAPYNRSQRTSGFDSNASPTTIEAQKPLSQTNPNPGIFKEAPYNRSNTSTSSLNPNPSIFNEAPYNRSQRTSITESTTAPMMQTKPDAVSQPPLPEERQAAVATVMPMDGKLNIKLMNATNAAITYQVVGDTNQRTLTGSSNVTLQNIIIPVTVTFVREDGGLIKVVPQATSEGLIEVMLDETTTLGQDKGTLSIEQGGQVFVN